MSSDSTPRAGVPLIAEGGAQKFVTHDEAMLQFDALLNARFLDRDLTAPPSSPAEGDTYLVAAPATGSWTGRDGQIAFFADGVWKFYPPFAGLVAYVADETKLVVYDGSAWVDYAALLALQNVPLLGVNASADSTNKFAVKSAAVLFDNIGNGVQLKLNKNAATDTASILYQTSYSGRAEVGLTGDDDFHFKVSADGAAWTTALTIDRTTGIVSLPASDFATKSGTETLSHKTLSGATAIPNGTIDASGNLGIRTTTTSAAALTVQSSAASLPAARIDGTSSSGDYTPVLDLAIGTATPVTRFWGHSGGAAAWTSWANWNVSTDRWEAPASTTVGAAQILFNDSLGGNIIFKTKATATWTAGDPITFNVPLYLTGAGTVAIGGSSVVSGSALTVYGAVYPASDNASNLGSASYRWGTVYAGTGSINTSGAATKTKVRALNASELAVAKALAADVRVFQFVDAVARKGTQAARLHTGLIFEDVIAAFEAQGLDPFRYGIVCRDRDQTDPKQWILGLRYAELAQFVIAGFAARLAALEAKI